MLAYASTHPAGLFSTFNRPDVPSIPNARATAAAIPRNPPGTLPTAAANRERMVAAVRHRNSNSSVSLSVSAASPIFEFNFAFWPFVVSTDYHATFNDTYVVSKVHRNMFHRRLPLQPKFSTRVLGEVIHCLIDNNLVFNIEIPQTEIDHPWKTIDRTLYEQLATHGMELRRRLGDVGEELRHLSWDVMSPIQKKSNKGQSVTITFEMGTAGSLSFNADFLRRQVLDVQLQGHSATVPFILIGLSLYKSILHHLVTSNVAPRDHHLKAPIRNDGLISPSAHACYPWRILSPLLKPADQPECITGVCPALQPSLSVPAVPVSTIQNNQAFHSPSFLSQLARVVDGPFRPM